MYHTRLNYAKLIPRQVGGYYFRSDTKSGNVGFLDKHNPARTV